MRILTVSISFFLALAFVSARQQVVGTIEKNPGKPLVAVTDFRATGVTAPTLMATFNTTVQSDLQGSPVINFIPKTLYPLRIPQVPNDLAAGLAQANAKPAPTPGFRLADWYAPPAKTNYLGIGYGAEDRGLFVVFGYLYTTAPNITDLQQAQVFGKVYTASLDQSGAIDAAHHYAADILAQFGGQSLVGTRIVFVSDRTGSKEIWTRIGMVPIRSRSPSTTRFQRSRPRRPMAASSPSPRTPRATPPSSFFRSIPAASCRSTTSAPQ